MFSWTYNLRASNYVQKYIAVPHVCLFSVSSCSIYPETQMVNAVDSHSSSVRTEVSRIENVYTDDSHEHSTATQKSRMDQQMSTALHGTVCPVLSLNKTNL